MGIFVTCLLSRRIRNKAERTEDYHKQAMPRKDFARSRNNTYCWLDTSNTGVSVALHNLDLTSDLLSYHSHGSKNGRQKRATKRYAAKRF